jgi:transposase
VVLEVGCHSPWISRQLQGDGYEVIVANPRRVGLIAESDNKSDRFDAEQLARLGRIDPGCSRRSCTGASRRSAIGCCCWRGTDWCGPARC